MIEVTCDWCGAKAKCSVEDLRVNQVLVFPEPGAFPPNDWYTAMFATPKHACSDACLEKIVATYTAVLGLEEVTE